MKFQSHWRTTAAEVISEVLDQCDWSTPENEKATRAKLREAYPFGEKKYHPYKIWLDEIARQMGKKWPIGHKLAWMNSQKRAKSERQKLAEWERLYGGRKSSGDGPEAEMSATVSSVRVRTAAPKSNVT